MKRQSQAQELDGAKPIGTEWTNESAASSGVDVPEGGKGLAEELPTDHYDPTDRYGPVVKENPRSMFTEEDEKPAAPARQEQDKTVAKKD